MLYVAMTRARVLCMVLLPLSDDSKTGEPITTLAEPPPVFCGPHAGTEPANDC